MEQDKSNDLPRRKVLKTVAIGGGVVGAAGALPTKWVTPVMDMVVTPAHAQTSMAEPMLVAGVYATAAPIAIFRSATRSAPQYALLDALISPASASHLVEDICGNPGSSDEMSSPGMSNIYVRINDDMTVDIAVDGLGIGSDSDATGACGNFGSVVSVVDGTTIPDVAIQLDSDEFVYLTNMQLAGEDEISGNYAAEIDDSTECSGMFTVTLGGGTFPAADDCSAER